MEDISPEILTKVKNLPDAPGVYRFLDKKARIIYIGKAKSLRKRVSSYFNSGRRNSYRIRHMVDHITDIAYTVTPSETEALLLENNLIKNHQPRYNIMLKDGKTYPYICIKNERFPRVFTTRQKIDDGSAYFGPYPSGAAMYAILDLVRSLMPLRTCSYVLSEENVTAGKYKRCLEFQIGNCAAPCENLISEETYQKGIEQIRYILRGNMGPVIRHLETQMQEAAAEYAFERAALFKQRIEKVKAYKQRTTVVSEKTGDLEVMTIATEENLSVINHFKVQNGSIVQIHSWEFRHQHQEEEEEILAATLVQLTDSETDLFPDMLCNLDLPPDLLPEGITLTVPQRGDKKLLVDLSLKNCRTLLTEKLYDQQFKKRRDPGEVMVEALQKALNLTNPPAHIECFDNSNFQGSSPVASCVVFKQGKPSKKDYRHFKIKTVEGPNDFASMAEIVERRYRRLLDENQPLPDLIVVDGGKGQLSSAAEALQKVGLLGKVPMIGIAKRLEEIYRVDDPFPLYIDKKSPGLHLIQQIRNEAHRFAITFHRDQRSDATNQKSALTQIKGIGPQAEKEIIQAFKSVKKLKAATPEELTARLGARRASLILAAIQEGKL
ncbi:MAG: excinuclease ABC subunit UvrC [Bacteroidia bacterium]|nr:excinuclease ABC subunit UvrC [Bacteroidia bacterium]